MLRAILRRFLRIKDRKTLGTAGSKVQKGDIENWSKHMKNDIGLGSLEAAPDRSIHPDIRAHIESKRR